ncbi:MAG TPA: hypothetical protein VGD60_00700 [Candidatus Acidoferrales bacterium]
MSVTPIAVQIPKGPSSLVSAGQLVLTMTAADVSNGNSFPFTGREILIAQNTDTGAHHITITSVADDKGRTGDVSSYALAAGAVVAFNFRGLQGGWQQTDGSVHISADDATVKFAILQPAS